MLNRPSLLIRDTDDFIRFVTEPSGRIHLVMLTTRPGVMALLGAIEWTWFPPGGPRAAQIGVCGLEWEGLAWVIASLPKAKLADVCRMARRLGMRIANGVPTILVPASPGEPESHQFPGFAARYFPGAARPDGSDNMAVHTVENDKDSPVYRNSTRLESEILQCEREAVAALNRGMKLSVRQIADYMYGSGPFPHGQQC
jgi:hypothetical protein